jgi:hypothetical protein
LVLPFYQVKDKYIFLHIKNYSKLNDIALKGKDSSWRFSSNIAGRKECIEAEKLRHKTINELYKKYSFEDFYNEWIYFDLKNHDEFVEDLPFLLFDYGCINKAFEFRKIDQNVEQTLFPDLYYDKDCLYEFALFSKGLFKKKEKVFSTIIDTKDIVSIIGELNNFTIDLNHKALLFRDSITLIDKNEYTS